MQDKDFDRLIREALENQAEPAYNPADWDMLEDRLHHFQAPQAKPSAGSAGSAATASGSLAKLGFVASAVLFTALNAVNLVQPAIFQNATQNAAKTNPAAPASEIVATTAPETNNSVAGPVQETAAAQVAEAETPVAATADQEPAQKVATPVAAPVVNKAVRTASRPVNTRSRNKRITSENTVALSGNAFAGAALSGNNLQNGSPAGGKPAASGNASGVICTGNAKPEIAAILKGNDTLRTSHLAISACETLSLKINARDKESNKIRISSNIASVLPGARFVANNGIAQIIWDAKPETARNQAYNFTLWLSDERCPNAEARAYNYTLNVAPAFTATVNGGGKIDLGQSATLEVAGAPEGATFRWLTENGRLTTEKGAYVKVTPTRTTIYRVQVISPKGCVYTDSAKVEVIQPQAIIPNIVTPNNDGKNDYFEVMMPAKDPIHLTIFDLRGKQVYFNDNYQNNWNAEGLAAGTYNYILIQNDKSCKGWVEVVR